LPTGLDEIITTSPPTATFSLIMTNISGPIFKMMQVTRRDKRPEVEENKPPLMDLPNTLIYYY
jgi:hypothetical protein